MADDSDAQDDCRLDKFVQPQASSSSKPATYSDRRNRQALLAHNGVRPRAAVLQVGGAAATQRRP